MRALMVVILLAGCGDDAPMTDAAVDSGADSMPPADSGMDSSPPADSSLDAPADAPADSMTGDAGTCDPDRMPQPNAGMFTEGLGHPDCHLGTVMVDTFCIDRYEATLAVVNPGGSLTSWSPFYPPPDGVRLRALSVEGTIPQGYISGEQAAAACAESGKRLCTSDEWLRACRGVELRTYPYGDAREDGRCNDARDVHPAVEYFGTTDEWIWSMLGHPCLNQLPESLERTGSRPGCQTPEGVFDMMGSLHEWTADVSGTFRGGYYVDTRINGDGCLYQTTAHPTSHWDYSTGFRCCSDPE